MIPEVKYGDKSSTYAEDVEIPHVASLFASFEFYT